MNGIKFLKVQNFLLISLQRVTDQWSRDTAFDTDTVDVTKFGSRSSQPKTVKIGIHIALLDV